MSSFQINTLRLIHCDIENYLKIENCKIENLVTKNRRSGPLF